METNDALREEMLRRAFQDLRECDQSLAKIKQLQRERLEEVEGPN